MPKGSIKILQQQCTENIKWSQTNQESKWCRYTCKQMLLRNWIINHYMTLQYPTHEHFNGKQKEVSWMGYINQKSKCCGRIKQYHKEFKTVNIQNSLSTLLLPLTQMLLPDLLSHLLSMTSIMNGLKSIKSQNVAEEKSNVTRSLKQ